jgi:hypothetical protein
MGVLLGRALLVAILGLLGALSRMPPWVTLPLAALVQVMAAAVCVLHQQNRWRERHEGERFAVGSFLGQHGAAILITNGLVLGGLLWLVDKNLAAIGGGLVRSLGFALGSLLVLAGVGWSVLGSLFFGGNPWLQSVRGRCDPMPLAQQVQDSWQFMRFVAPRIATALMRLVIGAILLNLIVLDLIVLVLSFGVPDGLLGVSEGRDWSPLASWGVMLLVTAGAWVVTTALMAAFRVVQRARRSGFLKSGVLLRESGLAIEAVGFLPTATWVMLNVLAVAAVGAAVWLMLGLVAAPLALSQVAALAITALVTVLCAWLLVFLPQMYVLPILTRRDCGWSRAFDASVELVHLEGAEALLKAVLATLLAATGVGIPAALHLLLCGLDRQELLLRAILREKSRKEMEEALSQDASNMTDALSKPYELLGKGRYLDALNGFQVYRFSHPQDPRALRGEALAMLSMGHVKAREVLERWASEDSENEEAAQVLREFNGGLWGAQGARFLAAQSRCTQAVGRGV